MMPRKPHRPHATPSALRRRSAPPTAGLGGHVRAPRAAARHNPLITWMDQAFRLSAGLAVDGSDAPLALTLPASSPEGEVHAAITGDGVTFTFMR